MTEMSGNIRILLIEDEDYDVRRIKNTLRPVRDRVHIEDVVSTGSAALELISKNPNKYHVIIMDFQIAGGLNGERLIRRIKEINSALQIIIVTKMTINITDFEFANRLMEAGAMWYCTKYPGDIEDYIYQPTDFILSIFNAAEKNRLQKKQEKNEKRLEQNIETLLREKNIIGSSPEMTALKEQIKKMAESDATVLIRGKSGTGKELIAANIHYHSRRKYEKFVAINCGSIPDQLVESELFGYEKGSFTGAADSKPGLLETAHKGTAFLDEIAELPLSAQVKLLRFLQEGELDKIGRTEKRKVDVRIIAATNKNIEEEVRAGRFREDLYYRLNVFPMVVPPLRVRKGDVRELVSYFLEKFSREMSLELPRLEPEAIKALEDYSWPGNVRELQNVMQRLLLIAGPVISRAEVEQALGMHLLYPKTRPGAFLPELEPNQIMPWKDFENQVRKEYFEFVRKNSTSDAEAARKLGLAPPNFHRMCKELGIK
ncbi:MAG: sigma-54 dependent transcriptional regulator [Calditrichia bacterium]